MERRTLSAGSLIGNGVRNHDGESLGEVSEIMLDLTDGQVSYAVLDMGGFLGIDNKLFAVPWTALELDTEEHEFVLGVEKEVLENAPGFDQDNWPDFSDRAWGETVHSHYGERPYWDI